MTKEFTVLEAFKIALGNDCAEGLLAPYPRLASHVLDPRDRHLYNEMAKEKPHLTKSSNSSSDPTSPSKTT